VRERVHNRPTQANKAKNIMSIYDQEALTALYKSLDFMQCNDLPCEEVKAAISKIESTNKN
jgi:hypothetical protein